MNLPRLLPLPRWSLVAACVFSAVASAKAQTSPSIFDEDVASTTHAEIPDRIPGFNRAVFKFNDGLYIHILKPFSKGYAKVVRPPVRHGIGHFFHNIAFPTRFVGNILEGKFKSAGIETARFFVNTVTTLGFYPVADENPQLQEQPSDLGLAFGTWGIGHGTYIVLPLLGPSSIRDGVGLGLSGYFLDPVHYLSDSGYRYGVTALTFSNESPDIIASYDQLKSAAIDPYTALRDAYSAQRVRRTLHETQVPAVPTAAAAVPAPN